MVDFSWCFFFLGYLKAYIEESCFITVPMSSIVFAGKTSKAMTVFEELPTTVVNAGNDLRKLIIIEIALEDSVWDQFINESYLSEHTFSFKDRYKTDFKEYVSVAVHETDKAVVIVSLLTEPIESVGSQADGFYKTVSNGV